MDVYVVSDCWWRDGASVIGASTDRAGAEEIADRRDRYDDPVAPWAPWKEDRSSAERVVAVWRRDALLADGTIHPSLYQEIVCVPLAGSAFPEARDPLTGMRRIKPIDERPMAHRMAEVRPSIHALMTAWVVEKLGPSLTSPADPHRTSSEPVVFVSPEPFVDDLLKPLTTPPG